MSEQAQPRIAYNLVMDDPKTSPRGPHARLAAAFRAGSISLDEAQKALAACKPSGKLVFDKRFLEAAKAKEAREKAASAKHAAADAKAKAERKAEAEAAARPKKRR